METGPSWVIWVIFLSRLAVPTDPSLPLSHSQPSQAAFKPESAPAPSLAQCWGSGRAAWGVPCGLDLLSNNPCGTWASTAGVRVTSGQQLPHLCRLTPALSPSSPNFMFRGTLYIQQEAGGIAEKPETLSSIGSSTTC